MVKFNTVIWSFLICLFFNVSTFSTLEINNESTSGTVRLTTTGITVNNAREKQPFSLRTQLKVARSLDPTQTESINVKSNLGGFATIIVKKRQNNQRELGQSTNKPITRLHYMNNNNNNNNNNNPPADNIRWNSLSKSIRFAEPTNPESLNIMNSFMKHIENMEKSNKNQSVNNDKLPLVQFNSEKSKIYNQFEEIPSPTVIRSDAVYVKDTPGRQEIKNKRSRSLLHVDNDGIPIIEGVRVPDDEDDKKKVWRNARVIKGELVPYEKGYVPPKVQIDRANLEFGEVIFVRDLQDNFKINNLGKSFGPFTKQDNFYKDDNEAKSFGPFTVDDNRKKREFNGGPYFVKDNSRISGSRFIDYIKQINEDRLKRDYFVGRSTPDDSQNENQQIQRRMLQNVKDFSEEQTNELEKLRKPISFYAHPDLGIQPARPPPIARNKIQQDKPSKFQYYVKDPALNSQEYLRNPYSYDYKKSSNYPYNYGTYPYNYGTTKKINKQPIWMKLSEKVRDTSNNIITSVEAMTRPVLEPIMEAGQKISKNLGFSRPSQIAQNKVEIIGAATNLASPALLPALGLIGGAALGIAVGRFLELGKLTSAEHKSLNDVLKERGYIVVEDNVRPKELEVIENEGNHKLYRRSLNENGDFTEYLQNVEQDMPAQVFPDGIKNANWKDTECAKKIFCQVMLQQSSDENILMEKKMERLLTTFKPLLQQKLSNQLSDVSNAIYKRDCSVFICNNTNNHNLFN